MLITALGSVEALLMCAAAFPLFRMNGNTFSEAASYAIICVFMLLSFIRQISIIAGIPLLSSGIEAFFLIVSMIVVFKQRSHIAGTLKVIKTFISANPVIFVFLGLCFLLMAVHTFLPLPKEWQYEFFNIIAAENEGGFSSWSGQGASAILQLNHLVLFKPLLFKPLLVSGTGASAGIVGFVAYLSIAFSTYALARRYSWPPTALTTTVLVMSMPRLVSQTIFPGTQIVSIAVALFCILAIYRSVELPNQVDIIFLVLGFFFCISENISSMIFTPILFILSWVVLFRRHGFLTWKIISGTKWYAVFAVAPAVVFSHCWLFIYPYSASWSGVFSGIAFNKDGIQGALANSIRYVFESFCFSVPINLVFGPSLNWGLNWDTAPVLQSLYDRFIGPVLGESGAANVFSITDLPNAIFSFGPVGFFLIIPALCYAMLKGPRRLKAVAISFLVYFYMICLIFSWAPDNMKLFANFYVCAGFSIAFLLPPWRFSKRIKKVFQAGACLVLFSTLMASL